MSWPPLPGESRPVLLAGLILMLVLGSVPEERPSAAPAGASAAGDASQTQETAVAATSAAPTARAHIADVDITQEDITQEDITEAAFLEALQAGNLALKLHQGRAPRPGRSLTVMLWDRREFERIERRREQGMVTPGELEQVRLDQAQRLTRGLLARHPRLQVLHRSSRSPVLVLKAPDRASLMALIRDPSVLLVGEDPPELSGESP